jgi:hypothetical protein
MTVTICLLIGLRQPCGSQRSIVFLGTFIISVLIAPVVMLIALVLTGPSSGIEWH